MKCVRDSFLQETSCCVLRKDSSNKAGVLLVIFFFPSPSIVPCMMFSVTENIQEQEEIFSLVMLLQSRDWEANWDLEEAKVLGDLAGNSNPRGDRRRLL